MSKMRIADFLFAGWAYFFQIILIIHFALRKWQFSTAIHYGWIIYALSIPAAGLSLYFLSRKLPWDYWAAGFIYLAWAIFGFLIEYVLKMEWRNPPYLLVFIPYILLYLGMVNFYWWPLINIWKPLWFGYTLLFIITTWLNITSHKG